MGTPYIGSKISLISKSEIRYEGTLYAIDMDNATVALSQVRSYGTEDRPVASFVPVSLDVYEYIIFRGSDIKDLHVCEAPAPTRVVAAPPQDPAIVMSGSLPPPPGLSRPAAPAPAPAAPVVQQTVPPAAQQPPPGAARAPAPATQNPPRAPVVARQAPVARPAAPAPAPAAAPVKFDGDFDFQSSNAKFNRDEIEVELQKTLAQVKLGSSNAVASGSQPPADGKASDQEFYSPKSSFFDSISCESTSKHDHNARRTRHDERKLDSETFGADGARHVVRQFGRGGGRGYGNNSRGRGRGGGGNGQQKQSWRQSASGAQ